LRQPFWACSATLEREMSARTLIGNVVRNMLGKKLYTRLRVGLQAEHTYLWETHGIIHIGANAGQERELYAAFGLSVMWIEPIPEVFEALRLNISVFPKQRAYKYLVADDDGREYQLHIADNDGASSSIFGLAKHTEMYPQIAYKGAITVRSMTLSSILASEQLDIRSFDAMVLDTQGSELKILKGAVNLLSHFKFVKVEVPDFESYKDCCQIDELSGFMSSNGFRERSRHPIIHTPSIGTYFEVVYERIRR
jgi:FkbM family methyltransferase